MIMTYRSQIELEFDVIAFEKCEYDMRALCAHIIVHFSTLRAQYEIE